jgi:hypothetical protein
VRPAARSAAAVLAAAAVRQQSIDKTKTKNKERQYAMWQ